MRAREDGPGRAEFHCEVGKVATKAEVSQRARNSHQGVARPRGADEIRMRKHRGNAVGVINCQRSASVDRFKMSMNCAVVIFRS